MSNPNPDNTHLSIGGLKLTGWKATAVLMVLWVIPPWLLGFAMGFAANR